MNCKSFLPCDTMICAGGRFQTLSDGFELHNVKLCQPVPSSCTTDTSLPCMRRSFCSDEQHLRLSHDVQLHARVEERVEPALGRRQSGLRRVSKRRACVRCQSKRPQQHQATQDGDEEDAMAQRCVRSSDNNVVHTCRRVEGKAGTCEVSPSHDLGRDPIA